jgi:DHA3 family macrolide efflux protein-like MFS transporter
MYNSNWRRKFFPIWTGQALSLLGSRVARFALVWWLTASTGSATVLVSATLAAIIPQVFLGPIAGAYIDRWNRRAVMIVADSFMALVSLWLAYVFWTDALQVWHVYVVVLAHALGGIFHGPAMSASTSLLVPTEHLSRVAGLNQALGGSLGLVGPPLGALALAVLPLHGVMLLDVATAALAVLPLLATSIPQPQRQATNDSDAGTSLWREMRQGLRYVWNWPGLLALMLVAAVVNFVINPAFTLLPLYVSQQFGGGAVQLGWMQAAQGAGLLAGGLLLGAWGGFRRRVYTALTGLILQGLATIVVGLAPAGAFWLAVMGWGVGGFMNVFYNGPLFAFLQATVRPEMQGRVFTVQQSLAWIAWPLSLAVAGPLTDLVGLRAWYVAGGLVAVLAGLVALSLPAIVNLERDEQVEIVITDRGQAVSF